MSNKKKKTRKSRGPRPRVHILPPSPVFAAFLPEVIRGLCSEEDCDHHAHVIDRNVIIDTDEQHAHGDYHTLVDIAGEDNVHVGMRPAEAFLEDKDGSLWLKKRPMVRYFPSIESFGIHVLGVVFDREE